MVFKVQIIRGSNLNNAKLPPLALTIGNFDGIHLGHKEIISEVKRIAKNENLQSALLTFEPHPDSFFNQNLKNDFRLQNLGQKLKTLQNEEINYAIILNFNQSLANLSAQDFIEKYLVNSMNVKHLIIGYDFSFGKNRQGNVALLEENAKKFGYKITKIAAKKSNEEIVSSSKIRNFIKSGNIRKANELLGQNFSVNGDVTFGKKIARQIGFMTANIRAKSGIIQPKFGVYKALVRIKNSSQKLPAILNFGIKPTLFDEKEPIFEVHIFNFNDEIYGQKIEIELTDFIREEKKFASIEELKQQIIQDCNLALAIN